MNHNPIAIWLVCALVLLGTFAARHSFRVRSEQSILPLSGQWCTPDLLENAPMERRLLCGRGVRLNDGDEAELRFLPGIGPEKARAIIEHRDANGPFRELSELSDVKGIGPKTIDSISPWLAPLEQNN